MNLPPNIELINLYWTTSGIYPGQGEISRFDFRDRVEASAKAGFKGIGIWHTDLEHITQSLTLKEMKRILDNNGMKHIELEFLNDWFLEGTRRDESNSRKRRLFEASEILHAKHVKVGDFYSSTCPMPRLVESFAELCKEAENHGTTIGFEIMGAAVVNNIKDGITLVESAGAKNGGLILDIYQASNLGMTYEEINHIPVKYLTCVELNDGFLPGSPKHDPANRNFCGDAEYDIKGFIRCIKDMGYTGPWAVEVISEELSKLPLKEMCTRAFDSTMAEFADQQSTL